uniref:Uncharacterized protein n=1 Tax=Anopheles coluzzii TaxID=1518534 RepID=A0A8W7PYW0_ANOCL
MEENNSLVYGLEFQARALASQQAESNDVRFFVATQSLKPNNQLHVVDLNEDSSALQSRIFAHPYGENLNSLYFFDCLLVVSVCCRFRFDFCRATCSASMSDRSSFCRWLCCSRICCSYRCAIASLSRSSSDGSSASSTIPSRSTGPPPRPGPRPPPAPAAGPPPAPAGPPPPAAEMSYTCVDAIMAAPMRSFRFSGSTWYSTGVSLSSISLSIFFLRSSIVSGVSMPAGTPLVSPDGVTSPSAGVISPLSSGWAVMSSPSSSSSSDDSSDSDSSSPQTVRSISSSPMPPSPSIPATPNTSPYRGLPVSSTGGLPHPPAWYPNEQPSGDRGRSSPRYLQVGIARRRPVPLLGR